MAVPSPRDPQRSSRLYTGPVPPNTGPQISLMSPTLLAGSQSVLNPLEFPIGKEGDRSGSLEPLTKPPRPLAGAELGSPQWLSHPVPRPTSGAFPSPPGAQQARLLLSHGSHLLPQTLALLQSYN